MGRRKHPEQLTPAEQRVLEEIKVGGTNAEIAVRLGLSINTVKYHVANMLAKPEMDDRQALRQWEMTSSSALPWRRSALIVAGLGAVAAVVIAFALFLPARDSEAQPDQLLWFETTANSDTTPDGLLIREIVSGQEHRITPLPDEQFFIPQWSPKSALAHLSRRTTPVPLRRGSPRGLNADANRLRMRLFPGGSHGYRDSVRHAHRWFRA